MRELSSDTITPGAAPRERHPAWLTRTMSPAARSSTFLANARAALPPILVFAGAVGFIGIDLWAADIPESLPGGASPLAYAGLVALQALALLLRHRMPLVAFGAVVTLDAVILATTAGELGIGSLAVVFGAYTVARHCARTAQATALSTGVVVTTLAGGAAMLVASREPWLVIVVTALARIAVLYVAPAAVAEYMRGRERLARALEDRARMLEQERIERAEREVRAERTALARELHDIAGHHLSGIIVSAQAATALTRSDPDRAREMMQSVQEDARLALADLRRTVGLLRSDDDASGDPRPVPNIARITALVNAARARGQSVSANITGTPHPLGPLAESTAYRMVQESLANAARHAPGAASTVHVDFGQDAVTLTVSNQAPAGADSARQSVHAKRAGYGLSGMAERAQLVGARLHTGPTSTGGWRNELVLPLDPREAP